VGLLQVERGLIDMLELLSQHPNWYLDLAGFGGDEKQILNYAAEMSNIQWHGRVLYPQTLALTSAADVVWAMYDPELPHHRYASPNKLFEAMMLSKPVIVAENTNIDEIVRRQNCGLVAEYGNLLEIEAALKMLQEDIPLRRQLGANGRRAYERDYSWSKMQERLLHLYERLG
jgi:glycosyltransferase involved in cell wall biosynthesis